jgi:hypothetical protein
LTTKKKMKYFPLQVRVDPHAAGRRRNSVKDVVHTIRGVRGRDASLRLSKLERPINGLSSLSAADGAERGQAGLRYDRRVLFYRACCFAALGLACSQARSISPPSTVSRA